VDSTYLLAASVAALGADRVFAITAVSPTYPASEQAQAAELAQRLGVRQEWIQTSELEDARFASNPPDRCYFCKSHLFEDMANIARAESIRCMLYGATLDDLGDHRPGMRAAKELGGRAPLLEAGLTKADVRALSHALDLPAWDKPAMACLASRFPYHTTITAAALQQVEQAEDFLRQDIGLRQVRVRHHDDVARLEVEPADFADLLRDETRQRIVARFKELGYTYIALDLAGFRSGSMNEVLGQRST